MVPEIISFPKRARFVDLFLMQMDIFINFLRQKQVKLSSPSGII